MIKTLYFQGMPDEELVQDVPGYHQGTLVFQSYSDSRYSLYICSIQALNIVQVLLAVSPGTFALLVYHN